MQDYTPIELFEEERYGLEQHTASGRYCLSHHLIQDKAALLALVAKCRARENDSRFMGPIPTNRGTPC